MSVVDVLGWAGAAVCLACYALARWAKTPQLFDMANALLAVPVALPALVRGAYPSAAVSLSFGVIGGVSCVMWLHER